ncbi:PIN domain-containing protein [Xylanimonas protaetiae]|uniref:PIN domain-containing protein n=1 Tax=Xylanimonas protaetiae TaxID=2509457 RepID=A0A4P6F5Y5_9MICO|nr:PIN domain-containing protein [Xylanimonas protaetiae]QAY68647.1 PIN domain-containing protein [Xylanimonas protaetiae]
MAHFAAVLDANVLVPVALADTLLRLAERELFRPVWSERILDEVRRAMRAVRPDLGPSRIESRLRAMNEVFDDACVRGWEPLVPGLELPDPDDRHVVAAAIRSHAELVVTRNLDDFPDTALAPLGIHALSPDEFLLDQLDLDPNSTLAVIAEQASAMRRPPASVGDVLAALDLAGAPDFASAVRDRLL